MRGDQVYRALEYFLGYGGGWDADKKNKDNLLNHYDHLNQRPKVGFRYRIVFWYDAKKELRHGHKLLNFLDDHKIELDNNEFGVKQRILM
ncbi:MAG: hypothetical protein U9Q82_04290 [Chloroflexota bacterium]|nr:hypothetical protein [Chloroflexota bacterium]